MNDLIGTQIGDFRVDAILGEGGMGAVYRAQQISLKRTVAMKVMHGHLACREQFKQRSMQETQAAVRLDHPSIVKIYDFGREYNLLYMVM